MLDKALRVEKEILKKIPFEVVTEYEQVERISTGSLAFDWMLGGGLPLRRITTIAGWESYGKTTLATLIANHTLKTNPDAVVYYIDTEHAYDRKWAEKIGINDPRRFRLAQPETAEAALEGLARLIDADAGTLFILDSLAAMVTSEEAEKDIGQNSVGTRAVETQHFLRKVVPSLRKGNGGLIVINQMREKIGGMGNPEVLPGGNALKFFHSIFVKLNQPHYLISKKDGTVSPSPKRPIGEEYAGYVFRAQTNKNKTASPFRECEINFLFNPVYGVDTVAEITTIGKELGIFTKEDGSLLSGPSHWHFEGERISLAAPSEEATRQAIRSNPELFERTLTALKEAMQNEN